MTTDKLHIKRLAILGVGLIGGSLARALRRAGVCETIVGYGRNEDNLRTAQALGVIDSYAMQPAAVVRDADMIVLATPLSTTARLLQQMQTAIIPTATLTDVGSAKGSVVKACTDTLTPEQLRRFVPGHPIAGTEKSGVEASFAELYEDHLAILTPLPQQDAGHLQRVTRMWEATGARVVTMTIEHHDQILAATSHLPHMLAYALVDCLAGMQTRDEIFRYAAGGFTDFTRIASSNPRMWADICMANRDNLISVLELFDTHIRDIKHAIASGNGDALLAIFSRAKNSRDEFIRNKLENGKRKVESSE
ncbi:MAG: prephenate dehydrogenase [Gammaproteobacteria bacterium]|nr:prephenate dehydrogenase [Gammaproteobacteria bacterium]